MSMYRTTDATVEPVTLAELKEYLRLDTSADPVASVQTIVPNAWPATASYGIEGAAVDTLGYTTTVYLDSGTNEATGTVDAKIQTSSSGTANWSDWTGGAFTQVTTSNDNAVQELTYTGSARYIRVVATVTNATCDFGSYCIRQSRLTTEDTLLTNYIKAARNFAETYTRRGFINQTWRLKMDVWPADAIILPLSPLSSVTSITYTDTAGTSQTWSSSEYTVDTDNNPGRITPAYGYTWPASVRDIENAITVTHVVGYGATSASVPEPIRVAIRMLAAHWYENREPVAEKTMSPVPMTVESLLWQYKIPEIG